MEKHPFSLIVFDWDGTLMDSAAKIVRCFHAATTDLGLKSPTDEAIRHIIGLGLHESLAALLPDQDPDMRMRVAERYRVHFLSLDNTDMPLFPGVSEGLVHLAKSGYQLAVATGKARRGLDRVLIQTDLTELFCTTRCADESRSKPHPQMLHDILEQTGSTPEQTLMVGDTIYDLQMAQAATVPGLAVSYGVHSRAQLLIERPVACLDSFEEVCKWLT